MPENVRVWCVALKEKGQPWGGGTTYRSKRGAMSSLKAFRAWYPKLTDEEFYDKYEVAEFELVRVS